MELSDFFKEVITTTLDVVDVFKEETDDAFVYKFPIPGILPEKCTTKVKGSVLTITIPDSDYELGYEYVDVFESPIAKESIKVYYQLGQYVVSIAKPKDYEFEVKCTED